MKGKVFGTKIFKFAGGKGGESILVLGDMGKSGLKKLLALVVFVFLTVNVFATTYVISNYHFDVDGKTQKRVLSDLIIPDEKEEFSSEEELVNALAAKRQALVNKRLFKSVSYEYSFSESTDEVIFVDVTFKIVDAKTFLFVPYPKYDSNSGTTINAKIRDKNMMGTFATLNGDVEALFRDGDWSSPDIKGVFDINNLIIGDTFFSIKMKVSGSWRDSNPYYYLGTTVSNIPFFWGTWFDLNTYVEKNGDGNKVYLSSSHNGVKILGVGITPSISGEFYTNAPSSNYFTPNISIGGINLWGVSLGFSSSVKFTGTAESEYKSYQPVYYENGISASFGGKFLNGLSSSITTKYTPEAALNVLNSFNYSLSGATTLHLYENVYMNHEGKVNYFDTGVGISQNVTIGNRISITPKITEYIRTKLTESDPIFSRFYTISASATGNYINWIGNFREGFAYSFSLDESWNLETTVRTANYSRSHFDFTYFKLFGNWFNPSMRVAINYQVNDSGYGYIFGSYGNVGEEVRGVLNKRISDNNMLAIVANLNLLTVFPMPKIFDFADYYASVFLDYALVKQNSESEYQHHYGFGVEGIGIFKEYPSYPIRLSIGIDLERFKSWLKDEGPSNFYEIYFGLDFFF